MQVNNDFNRNMEIASYHNVKRVEQSPLSDTRSQLLQNQDAPTPCCLGSCLIKIKDLFVALFSWLFCCKSSDQNELINPEEQLKSFVADLQKRGVIAHIKDKLMEIRELRESSTSENLHRLPRYFQKIPPDQLGQEWDDCLGWYHLIKIAEEISEDITETVLPLIEGESTDAKLKMINLCVEACPDTSKSRLERLIIGANSKINSQEFKQFLEKFEKSPQEKLQDLNNKINILGIRYKLSASNIHERLEDAATAVEQGRLNDLPIILESLPSHFAETPQNHDYSALHKQYGHYINIINAASQIVIRPPTDAHFDTLLDPQSSPVEPEVLASLNQLIDQCKDTNKTKLERLTITVCSELSHENFTDFMKNLFPGWLNSEGIHENQ